MMKKLLILLLALLTATSLAACSDDGEDPGQDDLQDYVEEDVVIDSYTVGESVFHFASIDSTTVEITGYEGPTAPHDVTIPSEVPTNADGSERKAVTAIADAAFFGISSLRSLVLPEGVTTIGKFAFAECVQLTSVTFPSSLQTIGMGAFHGAGLTALTLPEECGLTEIGDLAFKDCDSLTEITIPGYIETVGMGAFFGCDGIRSIELEEGVVTVGDKAFMWTYALESLTLPSTFTNESPTTDLAFSGSQLLYRENITCPAGSAAEAYADSMVLAIPPTEDDDAGDDAGENAGEDAGEDAGAGDAA